MGFGIGTWFDDLFSSKFCDLDYRQSVDATAGFFQFHSFHVSQTKGRKETHQTERTTARRRQAELVQGIHQIIHVTRRETKLMKI